MLTAVLALMTALSVSAARGGLTLCAADASAELSTGTQISIPVAATANSGYISAAVTVTWDPDALALTQVGFSDLAPDDGTPAPVNSGSFTLRVGRSARRENYTGTGVFVTLVFTVTENARAGAYAIGLEDRGVLDTDLNYVPLTVIPGTVTLFDPSAPTASQPREETPHATQSDAAAGVREEASEIGEEASEAPSAPAGPSAEAASGAPAASADAQTSAPADTAGDRGDPTPWPWIAAAVLITAGAAGAILTLRRKKAG